MRLVYVFILETNNQTSTKCLPKFVQMDNASSSIKTAKIQYLVKLDSEKIYLAKLRRGVACLTCNTDTDAVTPELR